MSDGLLVIVILAVLVLFPLLIFLPLRFGAYISDKIKEIPVKRTKNITQKPDTISDNPVVYHEKSSEVSKKDMERISLKYRLEQQTASGARWFYYIAALSLVNLYLQLIDINIRFIVGLGTVELIYAFRGYLGYQVVLPFCLAAAAVFFTFGIYSKRRYEWAFVTGMILYTLDGLLFVWVKDYLSIGFHIFALIMIYNGYRANKQLREVERQETSDSTVDPTHSPSIDSF